MKSKDNYKILGLTVFLAATSYYYLQKRKNRPLCQKIADKFQSSYDKIESYFYGKGIEELNRSLLNNQEYMQILQQAENDFFDLQIVYEEISKVDFIRELSIINKQNNQLLEIRLVAQYVEKNSLRLVQQQIIEKLASQRMTIMQPNIQFGDSTIQFLMFVQCAFLRLIYEVENVLKIKNNNHQIIRHNFILKCILDYLNKKLTDYPNLKNLVAIVMLEKIGSNQFCFEFYHDCKDLYYTKTIEDCQCLQSCDCCIFDLLTRYISIFQLSVQKQLFEFIKCNQLFQTHEHILQMGKILLKNIFYLGGQLNQNQLCYYDTFSPLHNLLIEATSNKSIQEEILKSEEFRVSIQYIEKVIKSNENSFLNNFLDSLIDLYAIIYPLFYNQNALKSVINDDVKIKSILSTFFGVLLNLETRDTYTSNKQNDISILDWFAMNMGTIFTQQLLGNISVEFILQLLKLKEIQKEIIDTYIYCLRTSQNKRIQDKQEQKKNIDVNSFISKLISLVVISLLKEDFTNQNMDSIIDKLEFVDEDERSNIFLNIMRIQFEIPSMNLNYLRYVSQKCLQLSEETFQSFNGYFTNLLNPTTLSYDQYMISMQLGIIYGKVDSFFGSVGQSFQRDLQQYEQYKDFLQRDLILIVDLMENPYYFANVLVHNGNCPEDIYQHLIKKAAISIWQLNPKINFSQLQYQISLFLCLENLPNYIQEMFIENQNKIIRLKEQYEQLWPFQCLQRDLSSVDIYLKLVGDEVVFNELLQDQASFEFLSRIQEVLFKSPNFIQIIYQLLLCVNRLNLKIWIGKILFYAKKLRLNNKECDTLLKSKECQSFIQEMPDNYRKYMLLQN
ncbi:unnamed protein product [Paramecium pentaurelia]|uniref:Uncharacterized protein n=1 Tax=Paramecium pentaurelia TaxID=43138 RepID=A0A8S1WKR0_9CILI|nr:unnamed protein product [Paramecium pentaurelia]